MRDEDSETTVRDRRAEWITAGVYDAIVTEALAGYDKIVGLVLDGVAIDGANRNDSVMLAPTLDCAKRRGLLQEVETLWLDRGYGSHATLERLAERDIVDAVIAKKRKRGSTGGTKTFQPMGLRRPVERTNSWLSNFGQLRRDTDRKTAHRLARLAMAIVFLLAAKIIDWRDRWSPTSVPIH